jgi:cell division protein FtsB
MALDNMQNRMMHAMAEDIVSHVGLKNGLLSDLEKSLQERLKQEKDGNAATVAENAALKAKVAALEAENAALKSSNNRDEALSKKAKIDGA